MQDESVIAAAFSPPWQTMCSGEAAWREREAALPEAFTVWPRSMIEQACNRQVFNDADW